MSLTRALSIFTAAVALAACESQAGAPVSVFLEVVVQADSGVSLGGVPIRIDGEPSGQTDERGELRVEVRGQSGRAIRVVPECPKQYRAEPADAQFRLRRYRASEAAHVRIKLECRPTERLAVFVVRAKNGSNIPIVVDDEVVATTNELGVAHFAKSAPAGTELLVELDATAQPNLRPRTARKLARLPDSDQLFVIDQPFESSSPSAKSRSRRQRIIKIE